jgi:glycosyltransferase involved in cell wall biosynthesis
MSLGIPAVATPLGSNPIVIENERTGFLANTRREWVERVELLTTDADLRHEFGQRAAEVARQRYTLQANADKVVAAFRSALS